MSRRINVHILPGSINKAHVLAYEYSLILLKKIYSKVLARNLNVGAWKRGAGNRKKILATVLWILTVLLIPIALIRITYIGLSNLFDTSKRIQTSRYRIRFDQTGKNFVIFSPIDWHYRIQRPQNLAMSLKHSGSEVLFVNPSILYDPSSRIDSKVEIFNGVQIVTFFSNLRRESLYIGVHGFPQELIESASLIIEDLIARRVDGSATLIIQQPSWWTVVERLQGNQVIFDCMDLHAGFDEIDANILNLENLVDSSADSVIVSSSYLFDEKVKLAPKPIQIVRNGVDTDLFERRTKESHVDSIVVGYFGALAEWFDIELMEYLLSNNPQIKFEIIGLISRPEIANRLKRFKNIEFRGEVPNSELPDMVSAWKAGLIPFKVTPLISATNPVKIYEYASLGIPTVASAIPEVKLASLDCMGIFTSSTFEEFNRNLGLAIARDNFDLSDLTNWASQHDWSKRASAIIELSNALPKVSVVILMWNNGMLTLSCLKSVLQRSDYKNLEIILVDNDSKESEASIVTSWIEFYAKDQVTYHRNSKNLGFAAGNNVGLQIATGDYIVLLNNDTEVTPGWIWRSIKHFYRNPKLGLLGPSTNNCGNEGRIKLRGRDEDWLQEVIPRFNFRAPKVLDVDNVAFFCTFLTREVLDEIGMISEEYGRGYFEDDDYCRRVQNAGFNIGIARDVFVYHHMGVSFNLLEYSEKTELFTANKKIYESKWGKWKPHTYALDADQS
jgi:GT2 family glycosyltransferase/glycosyltransferase involved in cell wall biosynthesis